MKKLGIVCVCSLLIIVAIIAGKYFIQSTQQWDDGNIPEQIASTEAPTPTPAEPSPSNTVSESDLLETKISNLLDTMTLEEKVAQLFIITPESLTGVGTVIQAGNATKKALESYPIGGLIYFKNNFQSREQIQTMISNSQSYSKIPLFIGVDEEGGMVARIGSNPSLGTTSFPNMAVIGKSGDTNMAYEVGDTIGKEIHELGFNLDFAPIADVVTNSDNTEIGQRSFGSDGAAVASMVSEVVKGLQDNSVASTLKHFPGHGDTVSNSHNGFSSSYRSLDEMRKTEFLPFISGIEAGVDFIMISHLSAVNVTKSDLPSSLSSIIITDILREELGYENIIITDGLNMGAVSQYYTSSHAVIMAIQAGVDMLLMPADFVQAYDGLLNAVKDGTITETRINESVERILRIKMKEGIMKAPSLINESTESPD